MIFSSYLWLSHPRSLDQGYSNPVDPRFISNAVILSDSIFWLRCCVFNPSASLGHGVQSRAFTLVHQMIRCTRARMYLRQRRKLDILIEFSQNADP